MITGVLIGESLRVGAPFEPPKAVRVLKVARADVPTSVAPGQPGTWTFIDFEGDDACAHDLARALAGCLEAKGGWYADFRTGDDHVVVFAEKVFRYRRGDTAGRAEAAAYGRSVGVPDHQLDWPD
jgi:hypothetical protein